jgi:uncharacterized repeat protein (TIGR02543 family)
MDYTFDSWSFASETLDTVVFPYTVTADISLYAVWHSNSPVYTSSPVVIEGLGTATADPEVVDEGESSTVSFTRTGIYISFSDNAVDVLDWSL